MPVTNEVEELLQLIGPFYELIDEKRKITQVSDLSAGKLNNSALSGESHKKNIIILKCMLLKTV